MADEELPHDLLTSMQNLDQALTGCEKIIQDLTNVPLQDSKNNLEPLERAKLDLAATYSINSLFWIYLVMQGVNPADHPLKDELERIKKYMAKIKDTEGKTKSANMKLDKQAAKRFVTSALWTPKNEDEKEIADNSNQTRSNENIAKNDTPMKLSNVKRKKDEKMNAKKLKRKKKKRE